MAEEPATEENTPALRVAVTETVSVIGIPAEVERRRRRIDELVEGALREVAGLPALVPPVTRREGIDLRGDGGPELFALNPWAEAAMK